MKRYLLTVILILAGALPLSAQQVAVNVETSPDFQVVKYGKGIVDFGMLMPGQGTVNVPLYGPNEGIVRIIGKSPTKHFTLELFSPNVLRQGGHKLPFTLGAAYDIYPYGAENRIIMDSFSVDVQFPPVENQSSNLYNVDIYIFLYGDITVGQVPPGTYRGTINISLSPND